MFQLLATVLESDRKPEGNTLTLGFPDANGVIVQQPFDDSDEDILHLKPGTQVSLPMVPFVKASSASADPTAEPSAAGLVKADHPAVIAPADAAMCDVASQAQIAVATPNLPAATDPTTTPTAPPVSVAPTDAATTATNTDTAATPDPTLAATGPVTFSPSSAGGQPTDQPVSGQ